ncbi:hypothetical protein ACYSNP_12455, partial [Myroides sp. LJL110]
GQSGTPGTPGEPGGPGKGVNMVVNQDGLWIYNEATGTWTNVHGKDGVDGKSAFEIWKEIPGNENKTIQEFYTSQTGEKGQDGKDGKSAFDLWKEVPGNENKTQEEFVAGLIGAQGIAGLPGQSGTPGTPGEPGGPGKGVNMVVNQDGLWIYNESTGSWINVHGKDGVDGKSAFDLWKEVPGNENKTQEEFVAGLVGAQGIAGSPGQSGTPGTPGEPGGPGKGVNMVVNQDGLWIYNEATGTWTNVHGKDGVDGKSAFDLWKEVPGNENKTIQEFYTSQTGEKGQDGVDGKSAFELWKEVPGNENKTQDEFLAGLIGAQGIAGSPGQSGTPGTPGEPGGPGKGVNMVVNQDGLWIYNESTGTWTNVHGKDGKDGVDGKSAFEIWKEVPGNEDKPQEEFVAGLIGAQGIAGSPGQSGTPGTPGEPGGPGKGVNMVVNQDGL